MTEQASTEVTRGVLHMREVEQRCQAGLEDVESAIAQLKDVLRTGETDGE